jgi:hypothetical protein
MDLIRGPRAMSLVKIGANLEVAAPTLAACVIVNDSKKRVALPDAPRLEMGKVLIPEAEFRQSWRIKANRIVPGLPQVERAVKGPGEESENRSCDQRE